MLDCGAFGGTGFEAEGPNSSVYALRSSKYI